MLAPPGLSRTGTLVAAGRYRLGRQIGRGSFGDVYLADELGPDGAVVRVAVLKILHQQWAQVEQVVQRFRREAQVRIIHPHVAQVFEYGQLDDGVPFIAMEYLPGRPLRQEMQAGRLELPRALRILAPICEAIAAAHKVGVVHRDLKPENVQLIDREARSAAVIDRQGHSDFPVVLDFGVAKFLDAAERLTMTGAVLGTPAYMSPEQFRGELNLGTPADVYALGVLAFEICAGRPPFQGRNFAEMAIAHTTTPAPPLSATPGVPKEVAEIVAKALDKEPSRRPNAEALARVLRGATGQRPTPPVVTPVGANAATVVMPDREARSAAVIDSAGVATIVSQGPVLADKDPGKAPPLWAPGARSSNQFVPPAVLKQRRTTLQVVLALSVAALLAALCAAAFILFR